MKRSYEDIIHLPHHVSPSRAQMTMQERAAQFAPFAALTGYGAAIAETARLTQQRIALDEYERDALDAQLRRIAARLPEQPQVCITYFQPDAKKDGGTYVSVRGAVRRIAAEQRQMILADGRRIAMEEIIAIELEDCPNGRQTP